MMCGELFMDIEKLIQDKLQYIYKDNSIVFDKSNFVGGLTNYNYVMNIKGKSYVIRQPGNLTDLMIDRKIEKVNNSIASELGLNTECVYFDEHSGLKISIYIENSNNMGQIDLSSATNLKIASSLMKKIHFSKKYFPNIFNWLEELKKYEQIVYDLNGVFFSDYTMYKKLLIDFIDTNVNDVTFVPCHNDTVPENFIIDSKGKGYLIDWEYSGMNDSAWDLAAFILESKLMKDSIQFLLLDYYGNIPTKSEILKIKSFMMAQDLLWTVWAMIRHYNGDDFLDYCNMRYERFKKNISKLIESIDYPIADMVKEREA